MGLAEVGDNLEIEMRRPEGILGAKHQTLASEALDDLPQGVGRIHQAPRIQPDVLAPRLQRG